MDKAVQAEIRARLEARQKRIDKQEWLSEQVAAGIEAAARRTAERFDYQHVPEHIVAPLSPDEAAAQIAADEARERIERKIQVMNTHPAPRAPGCCKLAVRVRRQLNSGGVEDGIIRPPCRCNGCRWCVRRRLERTLHQAEDVLLDANAGHLGGVTSTPRVKPVHVIEVRWTRWEATDKKIRRTKDEDGRPLGGQVGRLRIRTRDGRTLVIAEQRFDGSRAVSPAEALDMVSAIVDDMDLEQHSFRLLGRWRRTRPKPWKVIDRKNKPFDFDVIQRELVALGLRVKRLNSESLSGLLWRVESEEAADELWASCPGLSFPGDRSPSKTNPDTGGAEIPDDWMTPTEEDNPWT